MITNEDLAQDFAIWILPGLKSTLISYYLYTVADGGAGKGIRAGLDRSLYAEVRCSDCRWLLPISFFQIAISMKDKARYACFISGTSGLHQHLIRQGLRAKVSLVLESGEPREIHHFAVSSGLRCRLQSIRIWRYESLGSI